MSLPWWPEWLQQAGNVLAILGGLVAIVAALSTAGNAYPRAHLEGLGTGLRTASPARRLGASMVDGVIVAALSFFGVFFWIGLAATGSVPGDIGTITLLTVGFPLVIWFGWFAVVCRRGQSPGKSLVGAYVVREDGTRAGAGFMWWRELAIKGVLFGGLGFLTLGVSSLIAHFWIYVDPDKRYLWDRVAGSYVAGEAYDDFVEAGDVPSVNDAQPEGPADLEG